jgi:hypothetical protein
MLHGVFGSEFLAGGAEKSLLLFICGGEPASQEVHSAYLYSLALRSLFMILVALS